MSLLLDEKGPKNQGRHHRSFPQSGRFPAMSAPPPRPTRTRLAIPNLNTDKVIFCIDDTVYPIGASLKDLGKKWFAFSRMKIGGEGLREKMG